MVAGAVLESVVMPRDSPVIKSIEAEGDAYAAHTDTFHEQLGEAMGEETEEAARASLRDRSSPSKGNLVAMIEALAECDIDGENKKRIDA